MLARTARQASGRGIVLLPAAALLVHQLRYWLTYGAQASNELSGTGHAYLSTAVPWIVMLTAAGIATFAVRRRAGVERPFAQRWLGGAATLLVLYALQETLEGIFAGGHPGGFAAVFGHGGWWAVPVAVVVAFLLALLLRVADALARAAEAPPATRSATLQFAPAVVAMLRPRPLATAAAGRAPPRLPRR